MKIQYLLPVLLSAMPLMAAEPETPPETSAIARLTDDSLEDFRQYYDPESLGDLLIPLAIAGTLAGSNADHYVRQRIQQDFRDDTSDDISSVFLDVGDLAHNKISLPIYALVMWGSGYSGDATNDTPAARWASRSLRANILGGTQAWVLTYMLGSHRPRTGTSDWQPWNDNDGVSGHSFYGAVPFLTAAHMSENAGWKATWITLSTLPAFSRLNDDQHYLSQAVMGWSIAWLSTRTIARDEPASDFTVMPMIGADQAMLVVHYSF